MPRMLSNMPDAPYLGEAATLFAWTRRALAPVRGDPHTRLPASAYMGLAILLWLGAIEIVAALRRLCHWRRGGLRFRTPLPGFQASAWAVLLFAALVLWFSSCNVAGFVLLLGPMTLPWQRKRPTPKATSDVPASA